MNKDVPVLTWTNPQAVPYGSGLSANQLNATSSVPGTFYYTPTNGAVLANVGTNLLSVVFVPADTNDYQSVTNSVTLVVIASPAQFITASGGDYIFTNNNFKSHVFLSSGAFVIFSGHGTIESLGGGGQILGSLTPVTCTHIAAAAVVLGV